MYFLRSFGVSALPCSLASNSQGSRVLNVSVFKSNWLSVLGLDGTLIFLGSLLLFSDVFSFLTTTLGTFVVCLFASSFDGERLEDFAVDLEGRDLDRAFGFDAIFFSSFLSDALEDFEDFDDATDCLIALEADLSRDFERPRAADGDRLPPEDVLSTRRVFFEGVSSTDEERFDAVAFFDDVDAALLFEADEGETTVDEAPFAFFFGFEWALAAAAVVAAALEAALDLDLIFLLVDFVFMVWWVEKWEMAQVVGR